MQLLGIALGSGVAVFWGIADSVAALSARRLTTFSTTFVAQLAGWFALIFLAVLSGWLRPAIPFKISLESVFVGVLASVFASIGYFALYRALEIGPIAITSPLSSTNALVTLALSMLLLQEQVTLHDGVAVAMVILGVMLAATHYQDLLNLFKRGSRGIFVSKGVYWAYVAILCLGVMVFIIGASTPFYGWFEPVFWTRTFSVLILFIALLWRRYHKRQSIRCSRTGIGTFLSRTNSRWIMLAILAGLLDNAGVLTFGIATQVVKPGVIAAITSNYSLVAVLFGVVVCRERLTVNQIFGIGLVVCGLSFLAFLH